MTVHENDSVLAQFEAQRGQLRAVAYRILGSFADADDAVQETWLRLARADVSDVNNLGGWLTTVLSRVCLDMLRARAARPQESLEVRMPDPVVSLDALDPEEEALLSDSVGLALMVVLDTLRPAERLAFVLHDVFALPFEQIAAILGRSPAAAKQLASRARRRLHGAPVPDVDLPRQRKVVDAFLAAARAGDFDGLVDLLDPDVVLRADAGAGPLGPSQVLHGAQAVASQAMRYTGLAKFGRPALVNGAAGAVAMPDGRIVAVLGLTVRGGRIAEIDILADPVRLARIVS